MTEKEKQLQGLEFLNNDKEISAAKARARVMCQKLDAIPADDSQAIQSWAEEMFAECGKNLYLKPPFHCDYGYMIKAGENVLINFQCVFLDAGPVIIGDHCFIGPNCGFYTVSHPFDPQRRNEGYVTGRPITLKENVWLGGGCTILPGVTIGRNSIIGAGSVVTKDIPDNVIAAGNPARILKHLEEPVTL